MKSRTQLIVYVSVVSLLCLTVWFCCGIQDVEQLPATGKHKCAKWIYPYNVTWKMPDLDLVVNFTVPQEFLEGITCFSLVFVAPLVSLVLMVFCVIKCRNYEEASRNRPQVIALSDLEKRCQGGA